MINAWIASLSVAGLIVGSLRAGSATRMAVQYALRGVVEEEADGEILDLAAYNLPFLGRISMFLSSIFLSLLSSGFVKIVLSLRKGDSPCLTLTPVKKTPKESNSTTRTGARDSQSFSVTAGR